MLSTEKRCTETLKKIDVINQIFKRVSILLTLFFMSLIVLRLSIK